MVRKTELDIKDLSKKYRMDVPLIIKLWKKDKQDTEIADSLGIDTYKLTQLRNDLIKNRMANRAKTLNWH